MKGVQFISDSDGRKKAVVLDLARHGRIWEDVYDSLVARSRRNEPRVKWEDVKKRLSSRRPRRG
ncbi:MAG: hypothetical protein HYT87_11565 [Nitrospirae bacterium]|nr:hypothetical protein [Nitrospirota bacterium]